MPQYTLTRFSPSAVAIYEWLITLDHEKNLAWKKKWTFATWLFMAARYIMLVIAIYQQAPASAKVMWFSVCHRHSVRSNA